MVSTVRIASKVVLDHGCAANGREHCDYCHALYVLLGNEVNMEAHQPLDGVGLGCTGACCKSF